MNELKPQERKHFKMYKSGKQWLFAGIAVFGMAAFAQVDRANADETPAQTVVQDQSSTTNSTSNKDTDQSAATTKSTTDTTTQDQKNTTNDSNKTATDNTQEDNSSNKKETTTASADSSESSNTTKNVTTQSEETNANQEPLDNRVGDGQSLDATTGSAKANKNTQTFGTDAATQTINWDNWQENRTYQFTSTANASDISAEGMKVAMTVTATAQGDTAANGILKAIGVGVYKQDGTLAKLTDLGITDTSQLKDAVYTYPNGTTAHVKLGYYLNAAGQQVTDFNDAVELAYYVHPNDQNYSLFTDGKGADAGVNDKVDLNQSGASATYGLSISWDAKNFDNFAVAQHVVRGFAQPVYGSYSPQVIKEFYVDQDTGEQISPMTLLGEHGNFTDQYTVDSDNLSSLGYTLRSSYMYHKQETGGYTAQDVSNIWPAFKLDQQPAALVHYYVKTTDASNVVHFIDVDDNNKEVAVTSDGKHAYDITAMGEYGEKENARMLIKWTDFMHRPLYNYPKTKKEIST